MARRKRGLGEVTKKDFIGVAKALCSTNASDATITAIANYFDTQNANFRFQQFHAAAKCKK